MKGDLSVTALYTAGTWAWAGLPNADLLDHDDARRVFGATNAALALRPRAPSLRHALVQRHVMIDRVVADSGAREILELAAGLSRRGVTISSDPATRYTEVDRPGVIERKRSLLARTPAGQAVLARSNLRLVAADLADAALDLGGLVNAAPRAPMAVIAEGLLMYLDADAQRRLFAEVAALLADRGGVFVFDLVPKIEQPAPGAIGRGLGWMMRRFTGGADFVADVRTRDDVAGDLRAAGFDVALLEPATAPARWQVPHLEVATQQLVFVAQVPVAA